MDQRSSIHLASPSERRLIPCRNKVVVVDRCRNLGSLERFLADPHPKAAQERAGVTGAPTILVAVAG
jgi:hypothetical protein